MSPLRQYLLKMASAFAGARSNLDRPFTVAVEGNIGCGKTTFLEHFNRHDGVCVLTEPIHRWRDCKGHNLFGLMYEDPKKWSFTFQSYVQLTMLQHHTMKTEHPVKLMERSVYSARYCFVEKMTQDGLLHACSAAAIDEWFQWITALPDVGIDLIVYLRTSPEVVYERMLQRNRNEEKTVSFEYLKSLHEIHENWLFYKTIHNCPAPVLVLDANKEKNVMVEEYEKCEPHILNVF